MSSVTPGRVVPLVLKLVAAAGLIIDAVVHLLLAAEYDANSGSLISQGDLFRAESAAALLAVLVLFAARGWLAWVLALLVSATALAAVLVYRYADIGAIGPLPDMYEPFWFGKKVLATVAEAGAVVACLAGLVLSLSRRRSAAPPRRQPIARSTPSR